MFLNEDNKVIAPEGDEVFDQVVRHGEPQTARKRAEELLRSRGPQSHQGIDDEIKF